MLETIKRFLTENKIKASTEEVGIINIDLHPSGRCFETTLEGPGGTGIVVTYHGDYIPDELNKSPEVQLALVHAEIDGFETTFERWEEESHQYYTHILGEDGAKMVYDEMMGNKEALLKALGEDLFWKFYWLDSNAD